MKSSDSDAGNKPQSDMTASIDWTSESTRGASSRPQGSLPSQNTNVHTTPNHLEVDTLSPYLRRFGDFEGARRDQEARLQTQHNTRQTHGSFQQLCQPCSALGVGLALCQGGHLTPTHGRLCCPGCAETQQGFDVVHDCCDWLCGYRNVASLYLHSAHVTFLFAFALVIDGYSDACLGQIKCLSRALGVHRVTGSW